MSRGPKTWCRRRRARGGEGAVWGCATTRSRDLFPSPSSLVGTFLSLLMYIIRDITPHITPFLAGALHVTTMKT